VWTPEKISSVLSDTVLHTVVKLLKSHFLRSPEGPYGRLVEEGILKASPQTSEEDVFSRIDDAMGYLSKASIEQDFAPLDKKLILTVASVLRKEDGVSQQFLKKILRLIIGETKLRQYFGASATASISGISDKVRERVVALTVKHMKRAA